MITNRFSWLTHFLQIGSFTAALLTAASASAATFQLQTVVFPTDVFTQLLGINNSAVIAGYHGDGLTVLTPNKGLVFVPPNYNATASQLSENFPGSAQTQVVAINNVPSTGTGGFETGGFYVDANGLQHGFLVGPTGSFSTVDQHPGVDTVNQILGLNDNGVAAGYSQDAAGIQHAYTFSNNMFTLITQPNWVNSQATSINDAGNVVGFFADINMVNHGFTDFNGNIQTFDIPGSTFTQILGLNNLGDFVGAYVDQGGVQHGFFDDGVNFVTIDGPNALSTTINGLNDKGKVVGFFLDAATNNTIGLVGTVPEPASLALAGLGLALSAGLRRRRR